MAVVPLALFPFLLGGGGLMGALGLPAVGATVVVECWSCTAKSANAGVVRVGNSW